MGFLPCLPCMLDWLVVNMYIHKQVSFVKPCQSDFRKKNVKEMRLDWEKKYLSMNLSADHSAALVLMKSESWFYMIQNVGLETRDKMFLEHGL